MKANKIALALSALALVGGLVACGGATSSSGSAESSVPANTVEFALKTSAYSNDAKADINYFLNLNKDLTAKLEFENTFNGNGAMTTIAEGSWTVEGNAPKTVTLGGIAQTIGDGTVTCHLSLNASGLIIAGEDDGLIDLTFYYDETKKPSEGPAVEYATVKLEESYPNVTSVAVFDFSFTGGPVAAADNKVTKGNFIALQIVCAEGYEVEAVTCGGDAASLQSGFWCAQAAEAKEYAVAITTKAATPAA